jgi:hypothetical protein
MSEGDLPVVRTALRFLSFRAARDELLGLDHRHLAFGLVATWLVGIGRYWDDPGAHVLQHAGVGSLAYVVVLAAILWAVARPIGADGWSYRRVLTLVTLTSPPAVLYAIPVERLVGVEAAIRINVWFLAVVATWRVALLVFFQRRLGGLGWGEVVVATLFPLALIVSALSVLNLERATFAVMGGLREPTAADGAYQVVLGLTFLAALLLPPLLIAWIVLVMRARRSARAHRAQES